MGRSARRREAELRTSLVVPVECLLETEVKETRPRTGSEQRFAGIDSIRLWLALWVYFSHFGLAPIAAWVGHSTPTRQIISGLANNVFDGAAAVIGFFVISGLCIHYPYREAEHIAIWPFYARRFIRISIPLLAAVVIARLIGHDLLRFYRAILWSLIAELIYYSLYPMLRSLWRKFGWKATFITAYSLSAATLLRKPDALNFHEFGPQLTWLVGLPAWLLGCFLAETWDRKHRGPEHPVWVWRLLVIGLGCVASALRFHFGIGYPITLTLLGPVLCEWLRMELQHYSRHAPIPAFEWGGRFSYSIYLVHGVAIAMLVLLDASLVKNNSAAASIVRLGFALTLSYIFFRIVERPSHALARRAAPELRNRTTA